MYADNMSGPSEQEDEDKPSVNVSGEVDITDLVMGGGFEHFMEHMRRAQLDAALNRRILDLLNLTHARLAYIEPEARDERQELLLNLLEEIAFAAAVSLNLSEDEPGHVVEMRIELRAAGVESWKSLLDNPGDSSQMKIDATNKILERTFDGV